MKRNRRRGRDQGGLLSAFFWLAVSFVKLLLLIAVLWFLVQVIYGYFGRKWSGETQIGMLFQTEHAPDTFVVIQPKAKKVIEVKLDDMLKIPLAQGYGSYRYGVIDELEKIEDKEFELTSASFASWLGVRMVAKIDMKGAYFPSNNIVRSWYLMFGCWRCELSYWDKLMVIKTLVVENFDVIQIDLINEYGRRVDVDRETIEYVIDADKLEQLLVDHLADPKIEEFADISFAVINSSGVAGVASAFSNKLGYFGYDVVSVGDGDLVDKSKIISQAVLADNENLFYLIDVLVPGDILSEENVFERYRADVVIVLGKDFIESSIGVMD